MKVTEFSLRNPLFAGLIATVLALFGIYAYLTLSISIVPNITQPAAIVTTTDARSDPATVETQVTRPVEDALASLQNVKSLTSTSSQGLSVVTVNFTTNVNTDLLTVDVERAVNSVRNTLPLTAAQPTVAKLDTNSALPILKVVLYGPQPLDQIETAAVVGAIGAMSITTTNFTLFSLLGVTLLMGLVGRTRSCWWTTRILFGSGVRAGSRPC